jgi:hypothetical protein
MKLLEVVLLLSPQGKAAQGIGRLKVILLLLRLVLYPF